jgi:3-methyladenine DNA glycosylase AlkD
LKALGSPPAKSVLLKHGAPDNIRGVKVGDMKPIVKKIGKDYQLAKDLYATGFSDARYFAILIADETKMTREDLIEWVNGASWYMISEYTVPWIAAESPYGMELALDWIDDEKETIASAGWSTLANLCSIKPDEEIV